MWIRWQKLKEKLHCIFHGHDYLGMIHPVTLETKSKICYWCGSRAGKNRGIVERRLGKTYTTAKEKEERKAKALKFKFD